MSVHRSKRAESKNGAGPGYLTSGVGLQSQGFAAAPPCFTAARLCGPDHTFSAELHHRGRAAPGASTWPGRVLHRTNGPVHRPRFGAWCSGLHVLLHGTVWREWPLTRPCPSPLAPSALRPPCTAAVLFSCPFGFSAQPPAAAGQPRTHTASSPPARKVTVYKIIFCKKEKTFKN